MAGFLHQPAQGAQLTSIPANVYLPEEGNIVSSNNIRLFFPLGTLSLISVQRGPTQPSSGPSFRARFVDINPMVSRPQDLVLTVGYSRDHHAGM